MAKKTSKPTCAKVTEIDPGEITLVYECSECGATYRQKLTDVVNGTATCCDMDCELVMAEMEEEVAC